MIYNLHKMLHWEYEHCRAALKYDVIRVEMYG